MLHPPGGVRAHPRLAPICHRVHQDFYGRAGGGTGKDFNFLLGLGPDIGYLADFWGQGKNPKFPVSLYFTNADDWLF